MEVLSSYSRAWGAIVRFPVLVAPAFALVLLQLPAFLLGIFGSTSILIQVFEFSYSILLWFLKPLVAGATLGGAGLLLKGETPELGKLAEKAKRNYFNLLIADIIMGIAIFFVFIFIAFIIIATVFALKLVSADNTFGLVFALTLFLLISIIAGILLLMLQFYDSAIVLENFNPVEAFRKSFSFSKENFGGMLGVSIMKAITSLLLALPLVGVLAYYLFSNFSQFAFSPGELPRPGFGTAFAIIFSQLIFGSVSMAFMYIYEALFYGKRR